MASNIHLTATSLATSNDIDDLTQQMKRQFAKYDAIIKSMQKQLVNADVSQYEMLTLPFKDDKNSTAVGTDDDKIDGAIDNAAYSLDAVQNDDPPSQQFYMMDVSLGK